MFCNNFVLWVLFVWNGKPNNAIKLKGQVVHSQAQEIVSNEYKFMKQEADDKNVLQFQSLNAI